MLNTIKRLLGISASVDYTELMKEGAVIIDVRSKGEYSSGHIKGSLNIPLDQLNSNLHKIKDKEKAIITCCASGMRSASAKALLKSKGYTRVYNGGGWFALDRKIK